MTRISATSEGVPTDRMRAYYQSFAEGGFGLVISEGTYIDTASSQTYVQQPGIATAAQADGWQAIVVAVQAAGAKIFMQLQHAGALSQGSYYEQRALAPSAVQPKGEQLPFYFGQGPFPVPRPASRDELALIVQAFAAAAGRAQQAGADGVEIHGANGYLLDQFLTPYTNQRTDAYGGALENRLRLLVEVIAAVRQQVGSYFPVGIRLSQGKVNDYGHKWDGVAEAETIFRTLAEAGVDFLHVTEFNAAAPAFDPAVYDAPASHLSLAAIARRVAGVPVFANGQLESLDAAQLLTRGDADVLTIGKAALANHDFPHKLLQSIPLTAFDAERILRPTAELKDFEFSPTVSSVDEVTA